MNTQTNCEVDLHGYHPYDDELPSVVHNAVRQAHADGYDSLALIHGHGHGHRACGMFVNSNTGPLGLSVRNILRMASALKDVMYVTKIDCSHEGKTTVRLKRSKR